MVDRSSRPHRQPHRTSAPVVRKIVHLRWKQRLGPVEIGDRLAMPSSTVHAVLVRCGINRLSHLDRVTGEPIRRYEHERPGDLIHVDVKKLGKVPDGGGWRYVGRQLGGRNRAATAARTGAPKSKYRQPLIGTCFLHTVIDDHSRVAYVEAHDDETAATAAAVLRNAVAWFADRGVTIRRVLSDNGSAYRSNLWRETCTELEIVPKHTRPYRPQTNGKIERFHRTLAEGWAFKKFYTSEHVRRAALPAWLHEYNHHRPHTAIDRSAPITRLTNLSDQYN
jgi:transposase InsO family protein